MQDNKKMEKEKEIFAAISQVEISQLPSSREKEINGKDFLSWGEDNKFCDFLYALYSEAPSVQTIINGTTDFVTGNEVSTTVNTKREIEDIVSLCMTDYQIFGGYALAVFKNKLGKVIDADWVDMRKLRTNKKNDVFYYSEDWSKSYGRVKTIIYPKYLPNGRDAVSILYVKNKQSRQAYPLCPWNSALRPAKIETEISKFHLGELENNFSASAIINFNNGIPTDEQKKEIEEMINEKFCGSENAARFLLAFNANKENECTIQRLDSDNFNERYTSLEKSTKEQIFTTFRAIPQLFGSMDAATGFSTQEFEESFKLYNRTKVKPLQKIFKNNWEQIFGVDTITFVPFSLEEE